MAKKYKSVGFKPSTEKDYKQTDNVDPYPMCIELPAGYWTVTSTCENTEYSYKENE